MRTRLLAALTLSALAGCSSPEGSSPSDQESPVAFDVARSSLSRDTSPRLEAAESETFTRDEASFALDLYRAVGQAKAGESLFVSPHSVASAFAMTFAGARDETAAQMRKALHFTLPDERIHAAFNARDLELQARNGDGLALHVVNATFGQKDYPFEARFLDTLAVSYGAGVNLVDFVHDAEPSRGTINRWVTQQTKDRIKNLLPEGSITDLTRMVLVNAVHLDAKWASPFEKEATAPATFTRLDGGTTQVSMMSQTASFRHVAGDGFEAVALPYQGGAMEMLVVLPAAGTFATFEASLTADTLLGITSKLASKLVWLDMPKLKLDSDVGLKNAMKSLGMVQPFERGADFTGIAQAEELYISDAFHKTFVAIDEKGTEAAAATAVVVGVPTSAGPIDPPPHVRLDRPFLAAILDKETQTILFLGRVLDPKQ